MAEQVFPTKGNLIKAKRSLQQAKQGFELMDRKRNVLIREMVALTDKSKLVRGNIEQTYEKAYAALQKANITLGSVSTLTQFVPEETDLKISFRSVMGVELPTVELPDKPIVPQYDIKKTQKRANALKNIIIPKYEAQVRFISNSLEEKEREEFSRQKVIKSTKIKKEQAQKEKEQAKTE